MTRIISILFLVAVVPSQLCGAQAKNLTMSGFVTDKEFHPLQGAQVTIIGGKAKADATTDSDGAFVVSLAQGVEEGKTVRIRIEKTGYKPYEKLLAVSSQIPLRASLESISAKSRPPAISEIPTVEITYSAGLLPILIKPSSCVTVLEINRKLKALPN
jgi:hypothetical protein